MICDIVTLEVIIHSDGDPSEEWIRARRDEIHAQAHKMWDGVVPRGVV